METKGIHKDDGKPHLSLIDPLFIREVARALTLPTVSGKYAPHNWRNGIEVSRLLNSTMRHVNEFNDGEDTDPETGVSHLAHAACNLMFALRMMKDRPDLDDRYKDTRNIDREYRAYLNSQAGWSRTHGHPRPLSKEQFILRGNNK